MKDRRTFPFLLVLASVAVHALALGAMLLVLQPGVALETPLAARMSFVAGHASAWRLGWLAWQLTAVSDLAVSVALVGLLRGRPGGRWAWLGLALTVLAVVPDQWGEGILVTRIVAGATGDPAAYLALERRALTLTGSCAEPVYALMTIAWALAAAAGAGGLRANRLFVAAGVGTALAFLGAAVANARACAGAADGYPGSGATVALNGLGFGLLHPWLVWLAFVVRGSAEEPPSS